MSLDFCCDIQMVGSEFGVKNMKAWIHSALSQCSGWWWWCNGVWISSWHTLDSFVQIEHRLNTTPYLSIVADQVHTYSVPIFWWLLPAGLCNMSQSSNHLRLVSWTWQWVQFTQMASTVTRSQSNRALLGCGGTGDSHHGCAADKSAETAWCYHVNMDQNLWGMFPKPCLNLCYEELRQFWRQKGVQPGTRKV